jgi:type IV pilus assembly protein PilP
MNITYTLFRFSRYSLICIAMGVLLSGCGGQDSKMEKTQEFVTKVQQSKEQNVEPLPQFTTPALPQNTQNISRNPFAPAVENQQLKPDTSHPPGPLESFPLTQLLYVGTLSQSNQIWGLISTPTGAIYSIAIGQYIGQNYGKVTQITPQKITVQETVSDGLGGWVIRMKELPITSGVQQGSQP